MSFGWVVGSGAGVGAADWAAVSSLTLFSDALSNASSRSLVASVAAAATAATAAVNCACFSLVPRGARARIWVDDIDPSEAGAIRAVGAIDWGNSCLAALGRGVTALACGSALSVSFLCLGETDSSHLDSREPGRNNSWLVDGAGDLAVLTEL